MRSVVWEKPIYWGIWLGTVVLAFSAGKWMDFSEAGASAPDNPSSDGRASAESVSDGTVGIGLIEDSGRTAEEVSAGKVESRRAAFSLQRVAEGTMDMRAWAAATREAAVLSHGEAWTWFEAIRHLPPGQRRDELLSTLVGRIGAGDSEGAMRMIGAIGSVTAKETARREILRSWAGRDPVSALEWVEANREAAPGRLQADRLEAWMEGYARSDSAAAFNYAMNLPESTQDELFRKRRMVEAVVEEQVAAGRVDEALRGLEQLPLGAIRDEALSEIYSEWAKENPAAAVEHFLSNREDGGERMAAGLVRTWAETDPAAAADFVASLGAEDPAFEVAVSSLIERWSRYDLEGPGQWLNELPPSEEIDRAVAVFSLRASREDPAGAMTWAESISSESTRTRVMSGVAGSWKETDPAGFEVYLESSGLNEETLEQLRQASNRRGRWFR